MADLFTGANRRREFEEQRTLLRSQKTLFSEALDDFDDVLDKFEDIAIGLAIGRRGDTDEQGRRKRPRLPIVPPKPSTPFFQRPAVKVIGTTALAVGLTVLAIKASPVILAKGAILLPAFKKAIATKGFTKLTIEKQLRVIAKEIGREKLIKRMSKAFDKNRGKIMKTKKEANKVRKIKLRKIKEEDRKFAKDFLNLTKGDKTFEVFDFLKKFKLKSPTLLQSELKKAYIRDYNNIVKLYKQGKIGVLDLLEQTDKLRTTYEQSALRLTRYGEEIMQLFNGFRQIKLESGSTDALLDGFMRQIRNLNKQFPKIKPNQTPTGSKISSSDLESDSSNIARADIDTTGVEAGAAAIDEELKPDLALAPMGNVFLLGGNNNNNQQPPTIINQSNNLTMKQSGTSLYRDAAQFFMVDSLFTA